MAALNSLDVALRIDENDMTTSKKLYEFLGLNKSNYSRWVEKKIRSSNIGEEGKDYTLLVSEDERESLGVFDTNFNPNASDNYLLTADSAKRIAMMSKTLKGKATRLFFIKYEENLKALSNGEIDHLPDVSLWA